MVIGERAQKDGNIVDRDRDQGLKAVRRSRGL
jgi:hypothetical protein